MHEREEKDFEIHGGHTLSGTIAINSSKNGAMTVLCASLLNRGTTTLRNVPKIEEVNRLLEVFASLGIEATWQGRDLTIKRPAHINMDEIDAEAARKTRSILMFIGPLIHDFPRFEIPRAGGCTLGIRTVRPHFYALEKFGVQIETREDAYVVTREDLAPAEVIMYESGDTATANAIMGAARIDGETVIKYASANYQVQELCFFLELLGVSIDGIGTTTLRVHGVPEIERDVEYSLAEDPTDAMFFLATAIVTKSEITLERCPIDFLELELLVLEKMGFKYEASARYKSANGRTDLVDITTHPSELVAAPEKIHARPYPGLNMDNLPFFAVIATQAKGTTLIHDWVYEKRAIYYTELDRLGASTTLADPHRLYIEGPTKLHAAELVCPPALRPATILFIAMLAADGRSVLRNVYSIKRGYEDLVEKLNSLGAKVEILKE